MKTVRRLLDAHTKTVLTISPGALATEAMALMAKHDIGALLVVEGERLVGIITERDVARKLAHTDNLTGVKVSDLMTSRVLYVRPDQTVEDCMALMTEKHLRHLPVLEDGRLLGIISIRDVVADLIAEKSFMIEQLENYIYDLPAYSRNAAGSR